MHFKHHLDINTYIQDVLPFLEREEAANNLMIGLALNLQKKPEEMSAASLFSIEKEGKVVLAAMRTSPEMSFLIYGNLNDVDEASLKLCQELETLNFKSELILGEDTFIESFLKVWNSFYKRNIHSVFKMKVFRLDQLTTVNYSEGQLRLARENEISFLSNWVQAFDMETFQRSISPEEALEKTSEKIKNEDLFVWELNGKVVTMAAKARPTRHGISINYVYTPPSERKKGYATSCVARLSQHMLDTGYQFCSLFTDAANPTSNKIYQNMGYKWVADCSNVKLKKAF